MIKNAKGTPIKCKECGSIKLTKAGINKFGKQCYRCKACGHASAHMWYVNSKEA